MVIELHQQGVPTIHIAHRLNVAQSTVHYHLRRLKEPTKPKEPKRRGRTPGAHTVVRTQEQVAELLARGVRRIEIARRLGISKSTVSYHARRLGASIDERFNRRYDWKIVQEFYDQGNSVRDCMREFGFASQTWHQAVLRGLVTPRPAFKPIAEGQTSGHEASRDSDRPHVVGRPHRAGPVHAARPATGREGVLPETRTTILRLP
jgi:DNA-binding CsgD family transcriptional regulator